MRQSIILGLLCSLIALLPPRLAHSQCKVGRIDMTEMLGKLPETKYMLREMEMFQGKLLDHLWTMFTMFEEDFMKRELPDSQPATNSAWVNAHDLELRFWEAVEDAHFRLLVKRMDYMEPILGKVNTAIQIIMKEKGIDVVHDVSSQPFRWMDRYQLGPSLYQRSWNPIWSKVVRIVIQEELPPFRPAVFVSEDAVDFLPLVMEKLGIDDK